MARRSRRKAAVEHLGHPPLDVDRLQLRQRSFAQLGAEPTGKPVLIAVPDVLDVRRGPNSGLASLEPARQVLRQRLARYGAAVLSLRFASSFRLTSVRVLPLTKTRFCKPFGSVTRIDPRTRPSAVS